MNLAEHLLEQVSNPALTRQERARLRCRAAKEFKEAGDYEGARRAMGSLWRRVGDRPKLEGLDEATKAEVLLRAGTLTAWLGSAKQIEGAQETAKDLISEAMTIFARLGQTERLAEARADLAYCYWRQGAFDEARVLLREVAERASGDVKLVALIRSAIVERSAHDYAASLRIHTEAAPLFEEAGHALKGKFHVGLA
jgi:tetratricopeptide (TPR) repeat protein